MIIVRFLVSHDQKVIRDYLLITLNSMTNLAQILTGAIQGQSDMQISVKKLCSIAEYPYCGTDEVFVFNQAVSCLTAKQQKEYFSRKPHHRQMLVQKEKLKGIFSRKESLADDQKPAEPAHTNPN